MGPSTRLAEAFRELARHDPDGVWWAPGRVNLIGEHTDYNDGFVLPLAIERGTFAAVAPRRDGLVRSRSLQEGDAATYVEGVVWALREAGVAIDGADVVVDSTVPQGSGLSSSAALECSVALALAELHESDLDRVELARAAQRAENEVVGVPTGLMDQLASLLAREDAALFVDIRSLEHRQIPLDLRRAVRLLVVDTRVPRRLAEGAYAERRAACESAAAVLGVPALRDASEEQLDAAARRLGDVVYRRARHVVTENARVLRASDALEDGRFEEVGELLDASHASLRDDYEVSSPELDAAVEAAASAGAFGARMTGAGFGGCALALVPAGAAETVERAVLDRFAEAGFSKPEVFAVVASGGARRVA